MGDVRAARGDARVAPRVLVVGGSDSGAGAGIQADLVTLHELGLRAATSVTALTVQDATRVVATWPVPPAFVALQMSHAIDGGDVAAVKTGMLGSSAVVVATADVLARSRRDGGPPLVVDPVLASTLGWPLLDAEGEVALRERLLPMARVVTPNLAEAARLLGDPPDEDWTRDAQADAGRRLLALGCRAVLVKGGHRSDAAADVLVDSSGVEWFEAPRIAASPESSHGTGCRLATAIAAGLARGASLADSVRLAKAHVLAGLNGGG